MGKVLLVLVLIAVCVVGLAYYMGWFTVSKTSGEDGKSGVNVTIEKEKFQSDVERARQKGTALINRGGTGGTTKAEEK